MKESSFWKTIRKNLLVVTGNGIKLTRHEDRSAGIPDVSYLYKGVAGWIEIKYTPSFPVRATTIVRLYHFKPEQRLFIDTTLKNGGNAFILWRIGKEIFLFSGEVQAYLGHSTKKELVNICVNFWHYLDKDFYKELLLNITS